MVKISEQIFSFINILFHIHVSRKRRKDQCSYQASTICIWSVHYCSHKVVPTILHFSIISSFFWVTINTILFPLLLIFGCKRLRITANIWHICCKSLSFTDGRYPNLSSHIVWDLLHILHCQDNQHYCVCCKVVAIATLGMYVNFLSYDEIELKI